MEWKKSIYYYCLFIDEEACVHDGRIDRIVDGMIVNQILKRVYLGSLYCIQIRRKKIIFIGIYQFCVVNSKQ